MKASKFQRSTIISPFQACRRRQDALDRAKLLLIGNLNENLSLKFSATTRILIKEIEFHEIYWSNNPNNEMRVEVMKEYRKMGWKVKFWLMNNLNERSVKWAFSAPTNLKYS